MLTNKKNKVILVLFCIVLVTLSGCQNQSEQIYQSYISNPNNMLANKDVSITDDPGTNVENTFDDTSGELTIYTHGSSSYVYYDWITREFNKKYPNIKITLTGPKDELLGVSDYVAEVSADIMSGSAGDIIDIVGMPYIKFGKNNLLEDIYSYMERDPEFHKEDYYSNLFEAMEYDNKLWAVPMSFFYRVARFNKTLLEDNKIKVPESNSIDYKSIIEIYNKIAQNNDELLLSHYWDYSIFEETEYNTFFDEKKGKAYFKSQEFTNFLDEMKSIKWPSEEELRISRLQHGDEDYWDRANENDLCLFIGSWYQLERNAKLFYQHPSNLSIPIPMSASNGDKHFHCAEKVFSILSYSKNKELAWKFIRFCIEEKPLEILEDENTWPLNGMPINRNSTLKMLRNAFGEGGKEAIQMIDEWNSERNEGSFMSYAIPLYAAIREITNEYYGGRITAEDCARQIQERAEIYLKE